MAGDNAVHDFDALPRAGARGQNAGDLGRRIKIVVIDDSRPGSVFDMDQRGQRHAVALGVADLQPPDVLDAHAVLRVGLDVDLPVAVLEGEVVDVERSEIGLQGIVDVVERNALSLGLLAIDLDEYLGLGDTEGGEQRGDARLTLAFVGGGLHGALQGAQPGVALVLDLQFDAAGRSQAFDGRGPEDADCRLPGRRRTSAATRPRFAGRAIPGAPSALQRARGSRTCRPRC